jgi:hypothetical protein
LQLIMLCCQIKGDLVQLQRKATHLQGSEQCRNSAKKSSLLSSNLLLFS